MPITRSGHQNLLGTTLIQPLRFSVTRPLAKNALEIRLAVLFIQKVSCTGKRQIISLFRSSVTGLPAQSQERIRQLAK